MEGEIQCKPMFFKALVEGFSERLEIPSAFLEHIIHEKNATIWGPLGTWTVKIQGSFPNLYLGEGWEQFAEAHSLEVGYFLVFCSEDDMDFTVIILDSSYCRKEYSHHDMGDGVQFKAIKPGFSERLEIPAAFHKHIIDEKNATILGPLGTWPVKIQGSAPNLYFGEGWQQFAEAHGLEIGYFLGLCYEGDMDFSVVILDTSSCRKEYTHPVVGDSFQCNDIKEEDQNEDFAHGETVLQDEIKKESLDQEDYIVREEKEEIFETEPEMHSAEKKKIRREIESPGNFPRKIMASKKRSRREDEKTEDGVAVRTKMEKNERDENVETVFRKGLKKKKVNRKNSEDDESDSGTDMASATYRIAMKPRNLKGHYYLYIPVKFKEATGLSDEDQLILRDPKGNLWPVEVCHSTKNRTLLLRGWKEFCIGNKLRPGDDCEFQLAPDSEENIKIVQVQVFKKSEADRKAALVVHRTSGSHLKGTPWFWHEITSYKLGQNVIEIPNPFVAATDMLEKAQVSLRDPKGRLFVVDLINTTRNRILFSKGWRGFYMENDLKPGDICEFRPVSDSTEYNTFQVLIKSSQAQTA